MSRPNPELDQKFEKLLARYSAQLMRQLAWLCGPDQEHQPQDFVAIVQQDGGKVLPAELAQMTLQPLDETCQLLQKRAAPGQLWVVAVTAENCITTAQCSLAELLHHAAKTDPDWAAAQQQAVGAHG